ncbi:MAG: DNA polymerase III subunit alpha [Lachnospiraceae bacterium]|nr:DNA polymerase III subunit alpha [Lachnospiraceae bacterium]
MSFVHLHSHTQYSLLDGSNKIKEYVKYVSSLGMNAAAITDHGVMYGVIEFYRAAKEEGIKPIIGCEVYVAPNSRFDRELTGGEDRYYHLILLAENNTGYRNLMKIVSAGFTEGLYYRPRVDMEVLAKYHEGIIASSACLAGEVARYIQKNMYEQAKEAAAKYRDCFGDGNFFLELQDHGIPEQKLVNQALVRMSRELDIPLIATNDVHYTYDEDADAHDLLLCIQTGKKVQDEDRMRYEGGQFYVKSEEEMRKLFPYAPEAIENTQKIADRCNVEIEFGKLRLPHFEVPQGYDPWTYLNKLCYDGLEKRYENVTSDHKDRLEYELNMIRKMGFVDYFLIVWDYTHFARSHGYAVGPGRGSAAGSIVSYCLGITNIDPLKYQLLFERFLNPERVSMPDIDVDFDEHRADVKEYVVNKYGSDKVVQIASFGTLKAKGVVRDVGRVLDLNYSYCDNIAKAIPNVLDITLQEALDMGGELKNIYDSDPEAKHLIDMAMKLEGLPRHSSMHAAGVVICPESADELVPLARGADGTIVTQFEHTTLEELGLLKMDFLGLVTLTVIKETVNAIYKNTGEKINIDDLDYNDINVYNYIGTGKTDGVFQLESSGMKAFMKELKPRNFEDVIAGISLYRPGPMDFIPVYIKGKNSKGDITYDCPELEPILKPTYGCIVYQEQVMQIVRDLGGYTLGRADMVRRAMSKKKQDVMEKERKSFVYGNKEEGVPGCLAKGISESVANKIYDDMMDFAKYAFNKSHAAAYAVVAYQTAYLKYYHPVEFMASLLTSVIDNANKVSEYIYSTKSMGINITPPDINRGFAEFSACEGSILYGLASIKGVGWPVIRSIVHEREENGDFANIYDFLNRMEGKEVNKRVVENLIKAGAFDRLPGTRKQLMSVYASYMDGILKDRKQNVTGQLSLFDIADDDTRTAMTTDLPDIGEFSTNELLAYEKEVLGIYVSGHPLEEDEALWRRVITNTTMDFVYDENDHSTKAADNARVTIGGIIESKTVKYTKTNRIMAFLTIEDLVGTVEVIVWPDDYEKNSKWLREDAKVFIEGRVSAEDEKDAKVICSRIIPFENVPRKLWIKFPTKAAYTDSEDKLNKIIADSDGKDIIVIYIEESKERKTLPASMSVRADEVLTDRLVSAFGKDNVKLT